MAATHSSLLLLDIGNTHTHVALARGSRFLRSVDFVTTAWREGQAEDLLKRFLASNRLHGAAVCSVVPDVLPTAREVAQRFLGGGVVFQLTDVSARACLPLAYPRPSTLGADRLANAIAARHHYGAPCVAVDFGTAVTFDVVNERGCFAGGCIAPGLGLFADYLHEKTALLPRIKVKRVTRAIARSTEKAMQAAAFVGFRGLVRELVESIRRELGRQRLPVVATGGYARLVALRFPLITAVHPHLTLEGLRLAWAVHHGGRENRMVRGGRGGAGT